MATTAQNLYNLRAKIGLSRADVGAQLGINHRTVAGYENGHKKPSMGVAYGYIDLAAMYGLKIALEYVFPRPAG